MVYIFIVSRYRGYFEIPIHFGSPFGQQRYQGAAIFVVTIDMRKFK
jgi:hypothetical protein